MIGFGMIFDFGLFFWVGIGISLLLDAVLVGRYLLEPLGFFAARGIGIRTPAGERSGLCWG
jgi:hypothetical protein